MAGVSVLLLLGIASSGCTSVPRTAFWQGGVRSSERLDGRKADPVARASWRDKWSRMSRSALIIGFTGFKDSPENEKAINNAVEAELRSAGVPIGPGTPHRFLELGWRTGPAKAWKAIEEHIQALPEGVEPRIVLFGHSRGAGRALDIAAALAERGIPVAVLGMSDENKPWALTISREWIPANVEVAINARGGTGWSEFSGLRGRVFTPRNPDTQVNGQQVLPGVSHAAMKNHPAIVAEIAGAIKRTLEVTGGDVARVSGSRAAGREQAPGQTAPAAAAAGDGSAAREARNSVPFGSPAGERL